MTEWKPAREVDEFEPYFFQVPPEVPLAVEKGGTKKINSGLIIGLLIALVVALVIVILFLVSKNSDSASKEASAPASVEASASDLGSAESSAAAEKPAEPALDESKVFTLVYAISDDGFVNIRTQPNASSDSIGQINEMFHGLATVQLIGKSGSWSKVKDGNVVGYARTKYLGKQKFYNGGRPCLVAATSTPIYIESFSDDPSPYTGEGSFTVSAGTIIADRYESQGNYYVLVTGHDNLYIPKKSVKIVK